MITKEELLEEYNSWVNWLDMQMLGTIDLVNFTIDEEDFDTEEELVDLINDKLMELDDIIDSFNVFKSKIDNLLDA